MRQPTANEYVRARNDPPRPRTLVDIQDARGLLIAVREGRVWLTQEHDPNDVVVDPHDSFRLDRDGLAVSVHLSGEPDPAERARLRPSTYFAGPISPPQPVLRKNRSPRSTTSLPVRGSLPVRLGSWWRKHVFDWLPPAGRSQGAAR